MKKTHEKDIFFDLIIYSMMIVAVIYVIIQSALENNNDLAYKVVLGLWILAAIIINDFVEPKVRGRFDKMKDYKLQMYMMYAITDAATYACLYLFVVNIGYFKEPIHYVFFGVSVVLYFIKTKFYKKYQGLSDGAVAILDSIEKESEFTAEFNQIPDDNFEVNTLDDEDDLQTFIVREKKSSKK